MKITLENNKIRFVDCQGVRRWVMGCPLKQRERLRENLIDLSEIVQNSQHKTIADLYDYDIEFKAIAEDTFTLCKIDPDWLDIEMLQQFLLPYSEDGMVDRPILQKLNFPEVKTSGKGSTYEEAIAAVWSHTEDLNKALQALGYEPDEALSWAELQAVLEARYAMQNPEEVEEREQIEKIPDNLGFNGARMATPDEAAAILAQI